MSVNNASRTRSLEAQTFLSAVNAQANHLSPNIKLLTQDQRKILLSIISGKRDDIEAHRLSMGSDKKWNEELKNINKTLQGRASRTRSNSPLASLSRLAQNLLGTRIKSKEIKNAISQTSSITIGTTGDIIKSVTGKALVLDKKGKGSRTGLNFQFNRDYPGVSQQLMINGKELPLDSKISKVPVDPASIEWQDTFPQELKTFLGDHPDPVLMRNMALVMTQGAVGEILIAANTIEKQDPNHIEGSKFTGQQSGTTPIYHFSKSNGDVYVEITTWLSLKNPDDPEFSMKNIPHTLTMNISRPSSRVIVEKREYTRSLE